MRRTNQVHARNLAQSTYERQVILIVKTGRGFRPEWADKKPGTDPMLPLKPPGAKP